LTRDIVAANNLKKTLNSDFVSKDESFVRMGAADLLREGRVTEAYRTEVRPLILKQYEWRLVLIGQSSLDQPSSLHTADG